MMSILFEPVKIKGMEVPNRFVRSATYDGCADKHGYVSEKQIRLFSELAEGGIGLIITGIAHVHPSGQISLFQNAMTKDDFIPGLKRLTSAVQDRGAKIAVQLFHAGRERAKFLRPKDGQAIAPSFVEKDPFFTHTYRSMTEDEIWDVVHAFGDAAKRAKQAGFDAVQVHAAHAYLLSQFLSPFTNRREDDWGGKVEDRLRIHHEIYKDIRAKVGDDYPVLIKVGVQDGFPGGLDFREGRVAAQWLSQWGYDALEISSGLRGKGYETAEFRTKISRVEREAYFRTWCKEIKSQVSVPVMMVGGLRSFELMEEVVRNGEADFVSLSRPFIREPGLVNSWKSGDYHRATCISCNKCFEALLQLEPLHCVQEDSEDR
ncbi:MAG: NADH:flavin oxidoreductase [Desulfobacteraceae bacterium]|jgi:2,4-dienoyl-CoA reductase-like NADH-dependent reductase (Old Yellow Enzyme family)